MGGEIRLLWYWIVIAKLLFEHKECVNRLATATETRKKLLCNCNIQCNVSFVCVTMYSFLLWNNIFIKKVVAAAKKVY